MRGAASAGRFRDEIIEVSDSSSWISDSARLRFEVAELTSLSRSALFIRARWLLRVSPSRLTRTLSKRHVTRLICSFCESVDARDADSLAAIMVAAKTTRATSRATVCTLRLISPVMSRGDLEGRAIEAVTRLTTGRGRGRISSREAMDDLIRPCARQVAMQNHGSPPQLAGRDAPKPNGVCRRL